MLLRTRSPSSGELMLSGTQTVCLHVQMVVCNRSLFIEILVASCRCIDEGSDIRLMLHVRTRSICASITGTNKWILSSLASVFTSHLQKYLALENCTIIKSYPRIYRREAACFACLYVNVQKQAMRSGSTVLFPAMHTCARAWSPINGGFAEATSLH